MAKKRRGRPSNESERKNLRWMKAERQAWAVITFALGVFVLSISVVEGQNLWKGLHDTLFGLFGLAGYLIPVFLIYISAIAAMGKPKQHVILRIIQGIFFIILISASLQIYFIGKIEGTSAIQTISVLFKDGANWIGGGVAASILGWPFLNLFGTTGAVISISILIFLFVMLSTGSTLISLFKAVKTPVLKVKQVYTKNINEKENQKSKFNIDVSLGKEKEKERFIIHSHGTPEEEIDHTKLVIPWEKEHPAPFEPISLFDLQQAEGKKTNDNNDKMGSVTLADTESGSHTDEYIFPPVSLLENTQNIGAQDISDELKANAAILEDTLRSFGVQTRIVDISRGPTVTRYELQPSAGVKISRITNLADDIALNLAASGVRIEAPIPNKAAVGIEVPNKRTSIVKIKEAIESQKFKTSKSKITIALGKDISGEIVVTDIGKMPHLLIAGATGSGKSVCINSLIISMLYKSSPEEVKFLMIDPKVVELGIYNGIPHLLVPVVTDPRKAAGALGWAVTEMLNRYKLFAEFSVRDIGGYNALAAKKTDVALLPQIVIIIDELADLMMVAPNEVEDSICRLAQMARAAGMHIVVATQRPSVDVITGIIKANIPSRIAFAVSSQVDSRTILDCAGAEKLLGRGDMLFYPVGSAKPMRVQGCLVNEKEVEKVVEFIKRGVSAEYKDEIIKEIEKQAVPAKGSEGGGFNEDFDLYKKAVECVVEAGQASTSYLQRRLKLGYARAARLIDEMEERGIVGPYEGSKPRQVMLSRQQWIEMKLNEDDSER